LVWLWFLNLSSMKVQMAIRIVNVEVALAIDKKIAVTARSTRPGAAVEVTPWPRPGRVITSTSRIAISPLVRQGTEMAV
jgi:hypothetical protein